MHRLSSIGRHSRSTSRIVSLNNSHEERDRARKRIFPGRCVRKSTSFDCLSSNLFARNLTSLQGNHLDTGGVYRTFSKYTSSFQVHPEKLKQIMKARDAQNLCNYYDSEKYKKKAVDVVEEQSRVIDEGTPQDLNEKDISYEHMINCAQPRQKPKVFVVQTKKKDYDTHKVVNAMIRRTPIESAPSTSNNKDTEQTKYRKRTTILPLYLKKIKENMAKRESKDDENFVDIREHIQENINYETRPIKIRKPIMLDKKDFTDEDEVKKAQSDDLLKKQGVMELVLNNKILMSRYKPRSKYGEDSEEEKHWCKNANAERLRNAKEEEEARN